MPVLEASIERYLSGAVAILGGMTYKFSVPGVRGYPDRIVKLPGVSAFLVELKKPKGGRVAELQKVRHAELRAVGWEVFICKDRGEIDNVLQQKAHLPGV
jgi:hypothetical protein